MKHKHFSVAGSLSISTACQLNRDVKENKRVRSFLRLSCSNLERGSRVELPPHTITQS